MIFRTARVGLLGASLIVAQGAAADPAQTPLFLTHSTESMVMLNMSRDHELYFKAYDDYSDIDGDGEPDTTYKHSVDYYGYFDSETCYSYSSGEFVPGASGVASKYCNGVTGNWSGNFLNWATMTRMDAIRKVLYGGYRSTDSSSRTVLERSFLPTDAHSFVKFYDGQDLNKLTSYSSNAGISICNTTQASAGNSKDVTEPPLMRIAQGDFSMWTGHEQVQCQWSEENNNSNSNQSAITGINASTTPPSEFATGSAEYIVRVEVCNAISAPEKDCKVYPDGNKKPIGLLQKHGEDGSVLFGLMTGSYQKNKSGGVLRKNVSSFSDEVNEDTDGTFTGVAGIVDTLNKLRLTRYSYDSRRYNELDSCGFGKFGFSDGECSNWGNPQSELYLESLRYFSGLSATPAFAADDSTYINGLGTASWSDPLNNDNYCAPLNIIHFNASTSSFDGDQLGGFSSLPGSPSVDSYTDKVGAGEGVTDAGEYFVGEVSGDTDKACSPKDLDRLSDAEGVCPEAPWLEGTYKIAGLAYYANQNSIRDDLVDHESNTVDVRVKTYGVALSPAQPIIRAPVPGVDDQTVVILPACMEFRDNGDRHNGNCAIVDFRVVEPHTEVGDVGTGKFMVLWESAQHGGDYDQDMGGVISYVVDAATKEITVTTQVYGASTGGIHGFGYVISGTTQDGLHIHSGHNDFDDYSDPYGLRDCDDAPDGECDSGDPASSQTYTLGSTTATPLRTPLYYAAKWGGFKEEYDPTRRPLGAALPNGVPDQDYEWNATGGDDLPDNYFFARNPGQLSEQLATVFEVVDETSSASAVVANSVSFQSTTRIFQARFDSGDWSGQLLSFPLEVATGGVLDAEWDSGELISAQDYDSERVILSWDPVAGSGVAFRWNDLDSSQQDLLDINPGNSTDDNAGADRLNYLRGDTSNEARNSGPFRSRESLLGDNVNSSPAVVGAPDAGYVDVLESTSTGNNPPNNLYSDFMALYDDVDCYESDGTTPNASMEREPIVYFGANDGMLHGVSACTGKEKIAFVPNTVMADLPNLTSPSYSHQYYVDGSPTVLDAFWSGAWHTALVGSLRAGGKAVFALDVTDPSSFSEASAANIVLWELNDGDLPDLGYTFSQPAIIKAKGHGWVAAFGNGFNSTSGKAVLYMVDIATGSVRATKVLDNGSGNGVATIAPVDTDNDGEVDLIYAGDLKGNLWRVEASNTGFGNASTSILYSAKAADGTAQFITSRPEVGIHPSSADGRLVFFGTGKYYEPDDGDPLNAVQYNTMYGIWDRDTGGTVPSVTTRNSDVLQQQTIDLQTGETFDGIAYDIRVLSDTPITWVTKSGNNNNWNSCAAGASCGWYLDFTNDGVQGEKIVSNPILRGGRLIFVTTIPSLEPCAAGGDSWLMELDADNGGRIDQAVFDLNGDGVFDFDDMYSEVADDGTTEYTPISGKKSKVGILQPPAIVAGVGGAGTGGFGKAEAKYASGSKQGQIEVTVEHGGLPSAGRKSWIQYQ